MTNTYGYDLVDVFTKVPLEGNPLAVFSDGRGFDGSTMQRIARSQSLGDNVSAAADGPGRYDSVAHFYSDARAAVPGIRPSRIGIRRSRTRRHFNRLARVQS